MTVNAQSRANTIVIRFRFRSAAVEPSAAPDAPPNMSDKPPPRPECRRIPTTMAKSDVTLTMAVSQRVNVRTADDVSRWRLPRRSR
ncbi:MAG: hypothetical protein QOD72_3424 [Acidimicrobiaceae bacterium]|nr:hypothetical protein [Acidimicrobiaceae bacterium]